MEMVSGGSDPKKKKEPGPWTDADTIGGTGNGVNRDVAGTGHGEGTPVGAHQHGPFGAHGDMGTGEAVQDWIANPGHNFDHTVENVKAAAKQVVRWFRSHNGSSSSGRPSHPNNPNSYQN